jgi:hypothetical protein
MAESSHNRDRLERRGCKKTWRWLLLVTLACNSSEPRRDKSTALAPEPVPVAVADASGSANPYADDIAKICDVVSRSETTGMGGDEQRVLIANWLSANLATTEARDFLVKIQPLVGTDKADALDAEAKRVGLPDCALAAEWRAAP